VAVGTSKQVGSAFYFVSSYVRSSSPASDRRTDLRGRCNTIARRLRTSRFQTARRS
jgi:hypothetical protein